MKSTRRNNVNTDALRAKIKEAKEDPGKALQRFELEGIWRMSGVQFSMPIETPLGKFTVEADMPPPLGGEGRAPSPLHYCLYGSASCYAATFAQEAALAGVELRDLRIRVHAELDLTRTLGLGDRPSVRRLGWEVIADSDADRGTLERIRRLADERCPAVWCLKNPVPLETALGKA